MTTTDAGDFNRPVGFPALGWKIPLLVCGGIALSLDILDRPNIGFDEWVDRQFEVTPGYTPEMPKIEVEGYSPLAPGMLIVDMNGDGNPLSKEEMSKLADIMLNNGHNPKSTLILVLDPKLIHEVALAIRHIHEGSDTKVVYDTLSPAGQSAFATLSERLNAGKDVVMTDKNGFTIRPVQRIELIRGPSIRH